MQFFRTLTMLSMALLATTAVAAPAIINFHGPESHKDIRYKFHWEILERAMQVTEKTYGKVNLHQTFFMTEDRQVELMKKNSEVLTVMIRETSVEHEANLTPVRLPIDRNLIGYRLFLTNKENSKKLSKVQNLEDLKPLTLVQGSNWGDVHILRAANLAVKEELYYDDLFKLTALGRYDAFPRGFTEIKGEIDKYGPLHPQLTVDKSLLLYYPLPTYFWFHKTAEGKKLAERTEAGMLKLVHTGEYEQIFLKHYGPNLKKFHLKSRKVLRVPNPLLPKNMPNWDAFWNFNPLD